MGIPEVIALLGLLASIGGSIGSGIASKRQQSRAFAKQADYEKREEDKQKKARAEAVVDAKKKSMLRAMGYDTGSPLTSGDLYTQGAKPQQESGGAAQALAGMSQGIMQATPILYDLAKNRQQATQGSAPSRFDWGTRNSPYNMNYKGTIMQSSPDFYGA